MQFADPRTDFAFKKKFGNDQAKEVLISFLNAVLGLEASHAIAEVTILNPYQAPKISTLKHSYLDNFSFFVSPHAAISPQTPQRGQSATKKD